MTHRQGGMAEPVVLVPGLMSDARVFARQIARLSAARPVMVAAPVTGERVEEMASALLPLLPARYALAGQGLGGVVAMEILRRAPERVNRLALISTDPLADTPANAAERDLMIARARAGRLDQAMEEAMRPEWLAPGQTRIEVMALIRAMARDLGADVFQRQMRALQRRSDFQSVLRRLRVPVMIVSGAADTRLPLKRQHFTASLIEGAVFRPVEGAGHMPSAEQPEATADALEDWLRQPLVLA